MVDVAIAVVTYNSGDVVGGLLASLDEGLAGVGSWRLVVVDNASDDGTPELVRSLEPRATVVAAGGNRGYAAGLNTAMREAGPFASLLVLNPDVRLTPGCVATMVQALDQSEVGIVAPMLRRGDGSLIHSLRREATVLGALGAALLGGRVAGRLPGLGEVVTDPGRYRRPTTSDWASGPALLISAACLRAAGPWDERFFLYSEETEFALRARDAGFALRYEPRASVVHLEGESHGNAALWGLLVANRVRLFRRRNGRLRSAAFWLATLLGELLRAPRNRVHRGGVKALLVGSPLQPPAGGSGPRGREEGGPRAA